MTDSSKFPKFTRPRQPFALAVAFTIVLTLAACGGPSRSAEAAACLRNMLDNDKATSSCQHPTVINVSPGPGNALSNTVAKPTNTAGRVTCIRQTGNEFTCQASNGSYQVTYDGTHLAYTQTG